MGQRASGLHQQFERVVEGRGIAAAGLNDRKQLLQIVAEELRLQHRLPRVHPVHVAAHCVDFPVVRHIAERMRQIPRRERVGREALVHEAHRAREIRIRKLAVKLRDLRREKQTFIDNGARRKRRHAEEVAVRHVGRGDFRLHALAHHVELAIELIGRHALRVPDENLFDVRLRIARHAAHGASIDRRIAPAEHGESFFSYDAFDDAFGFEPLLPLHRKKNNPHTILARRRKTEAQLGGLARKILVRDLNQQPGAVAGFRIAAARAAMRQVDENLNALLDDLVCFLALDVSHKPDPAGVVFVAWMVQSRRFREAAHSFPILAAGLFHYQAFKF